MELKFSNEDIEMAKKHFAVVNNLSHSSEKCVLVNLTPFKMATIKGGKKKKILDAGLV